MSVKIVNFDITSLMLVVVMQMMSVQMTYSTLIRIQHNVTDVENVTTETSAIKKGPTCHDPFVNKETGYTLDNSTRKKYSLFAFGDYILVSWYYNAGFKSCYPLYSHGAVQHYLGNVDLPKTKLECEDLCAEPCMLEDLSYGIYMSKDYCEQYNTSLTYTVDDVKCCPRYSSAHPIPTTLHIVQHPIIEISGDGEKINTRWNSPPINSPMF